MPKIFESRHFGFERFPVGPGLPVLLVCGEAAYRASLGPGLGIHRYSKVALPFDAGDGDDGDALAPLLHKLASRAVVVWPAAEDGGFARATLHARMIADGGASAVGVVPAGEAFDLAAALPFGVEPSDVGARVDAALALAVQRALPRQGARPARAVVNAVASVDGAPLFARVRGVFSRYLAEGDVALDTLALWVMQAWCVLTPGAGKPSGFAFDMSPRLVLSANDARADHGRALRLAAWLTPSPLLVSRTVAAHLAHAIAAERPTLLLDDVAGGMLARRDMRALIAAGALRDGLFLGMGSRRHPSGRFACFAPAAIATAARLSDDVAVRAIVVPMAPPPFSHARAGLGDVANEVLDLRAEMQAFAAQASFADAGAAMPRGLSAVAQDNWRPLFVVAAAIGPEVLACAVATARTLAEAEPAPSSNLALLADMRALVRTAPPGAATADVVAALTADPERPWATIKRGRKIDARELAERLRGFGVRPATLRMADETFVRGYRTDDLAEAFARYLGPSPITCDGKVAAE